jgi:hypothetical protein
MSKNLRSLLTGFYFTAVIWMGVAMIGYVVALNRYDGIKQRLPGVATRGVIESRWSWTLGLFGTSCFRLAGSRENFCYKNSYLKPEVGNIFWELTPGREVQLKAQSGYVRELLVDLSTTMRALVHYDYSYGMVTEATLASGGGSGFILGGLAFITLLTLAWFKFVRARVHALARR